MFNFFAALVVFLARKRAHPCDENDPASGQNNADGEVDSTLLSSSNTHISWHLLLLITVVIIIIIIYLFRWQYLTDIAAAVTLHGRSLPRLCLTAIADEPLMLHADWDLTQLPSGLCVSEQRKGEEAEGGIEKGSWDEDADNRKLAEQEALK